MTQDPAPRPLLIDGLQFCRWSREIFEDMTAAGMAAVHVTVSYHENFRKTVEHLVDWNWRLRENEDLLLLGRDATDIDRARRSARTAIFLGLQTPMPIEDDLGLVEVLHSLGIRFMQLTYNNQSLLGSGWMEAQDGGLTRMGREVIGEMNRLGMVVDLSHSGERTSLEAIEASPRPVAITHANPSWWRSTPRNKSRTVLRALAATRGMLGLSIYPHHLEDGSATSLESFCAMAADAASFLGVDNLGIGSDLCQGHPDAMVRWMREGRWTRPAKGGEAVRFPDQPAWFCSNRDFPRLGAGLQRVGFAPEDIDKILGGNWYRFMGEAFEAEQEDSPGDVDIRHDLNKESSNLQQGAAQ